jgi:hypothetical protein
MQDVFYEECSKIINEKSERIKYNILNVLSIFFIIACFLWAIICFFVFDVSSSRIVYTIILTGLPIVLFIISTYLCIRFKNSFCVQYDYTFVTGSIRIDKVINNRKRFPLYNFEYNQIGVLGRFASDTYFNLGANPDVNRQLLTSDTSAVDLFYLYVNVNNQQELLILQCSEQFIAHIVRFAGRSILEKDFKC